jgi:uncharacterized alpha-E superfamily protein
LRAVLIFRVPPEVELLVLQSVLAAAESFTLYRRRYRNQPQLETTVDLLLLDESNSRSLVYQLNAARQHLAMLPGQESRPYKKEMRRLIEAATLLKLANVDDLVNADEDMRGQLENLLAGLGQSLAEVSDAVTATYFTHAERPYQLVDEEL